MCVQCHTYPPRNYRRFKECQVNCVGEQEKVTQTYLLWIPDVCTFQFYHMFEESHKNTHHIKWNFDQGEVFNTFLHQIACRERSL